MKILKHGKKNCIFVCPSCECEFIPTNSEKTNKTTCVCPDCGDAVCLATENMFNDRWNDFEKIKEQILEIIDLDKIHETMVLLNWEWFGVGVPTTYQLSEKLVELMAEAWDGRTSIRTGGFYVKYWPQDEDCIEGIEVSFEVTNANCYINENHEIEFF